LHISLGLFKVNGKTSRNRPDNRCQIHTK